MSERAKSIQLEIHNAVTVVTQKAEELYGMVVRSEQQRHGLDREMQMIRNTVPAPGNGVESRDLMKRIEALQTQLDTKTLENERLREFGKLKDRAKMKVERDRDAYLAALGTRNKEVDQLRKQVGDFHQMTAQNRAQAEAYLKLEGELNRVREFYRNNRTRINELESQRDHWEGEYNRLCDRMERVQRAVGEW